MISVPETLFHEASLIDKGIMPSPRMAIVNLTYTCNQKCYYCFWKDWNNKETKTEPVERIPELLYQLKEVGIQAIEFCGGGEPTCCKDFTNIVYKAEELGFKIGMLTNGVKLCGDIAVAVLKTMTYVRVSLDTVNSEIYKQVRGTDECQTVIENIKNLISLKKELNSDTQISIKIGISKEIGEREINEVFYYFDGWDIYNIQVKNLWNEKGTHYRRDINRVELMRIEGGHNIPVVKKVTYPKYMSEQCWITPVQLQADVYGDIYLCCYTMYRKNGHKIGNIYETPLKELWGSKQHRDVIANIKISECLCHDCRFQKYMKIIRKLQRNGTWCFL